MKKIILCVLILIMIIIIVPGCSTNNNAGPTASIPIPGKLLGTDGQGTPRVSNVPVSTEATLNPLLSPASTF